MSRFRRMIMAAVAAVFSCFGSGAWMGYMPWTDNEGWKD